MIEKKDPAIIESFFEDNSNLKEGVAQSVLFPETPDEVSSILKDAYRSKTAVTISGGGTGTVGGRIPFGGVVISTERLNTVLKILTYSSDGGYVRVESGLLLNDLVEAVRKQGLFYPPNPTEVAASIGGTIATNASGSRSFKYGTTRNYVSYLKLVLGNGEVLEVKRGEIFARGRKFQLLIGGKEVSFSVPSYSMPGVKKHSAGFYAQDNMDLIDLFIGQEGCLGVVVEAELKLLKAPEDIFSCFAFFNSEQDARDFSIRAKSLDPLALEYFDANSLQLLREEYPHIPGNARGSIFFEQEVASANEEEIIEKWRGLLEEYGVALGDTWVASSLREREKFYEFRHRLPDLISEIVKKNSQPKIATDIAVSESNFTEMLEFYLNTLKPCGIDYLIFGHIGDCHLHVNLLARTKEEWEKSRELASEFIDKAISLGGTVSGEHGIGKLKHQFLHKLYGEQGIDEMIQLKRALDPHFILNRGNLFPADEEY